MTDSNNYQIRLTEQYDSTYAYLLKKHYKKDSKSKKLFEELIQNLVIELKTNPFSNNYSSKEPFPQGCANQLMEFRKKRWTRLPGLQGASALGRLIFLVVKPSQTIYFLWIYTHQEYNKRPPDKDLRQLLLNICKNENIDFR